MGSPLTRNILAGSSCHSSAEQEVTCRHGQVVPSRMLVWITRGADRVKLVLQPVKVTPKCYKLFEAELPGMTELCNAFKTQYQTTLQSQRQLVGTPRVPGMTPFGGGRTPGGARTPGPLGSRTPGGQPPRPPGMGTPLHSIPAFANGSSTPLVRPPGMGTPSMSAPYGSATPMRPNYGAMTPRPPGMGTPFMRPDMHCEIRCPNVKEVPLTDRSFASTVDGSGTPNLRTSGLSC